MQNRFFSKEKPLKVSYGMGNDKYDKDGRLVVAEYEKYQVVAVYVPNSGEGLVNLPFRMEWDKDFTDFLVVSFTFNITYLPTLFAPSKRDHECHI